jgi:dTDP-4-amino-4,6-dideoxygalactose transaminase
VEVAPRLYEEVLTIPSSVGLTRQDQDSVIAALWECSAAAKSSSIKAGSSW